MGSKKSPLRGQMRIGIYGYRDYDPDVGRWTAKDPIGFQSGVVDLYGYCLILQRTFDVIGFSQFDAFCPVRLIGSEISV